MDTTITCSFHVAGSQPLQVGKEAAEVGGEVEDSVCTRRDEDGHEVRTLCALHAGV